MSTDYQHLPIDAISTERLAQRSLRLGLVDTGDENEFRRWLQADARGFHDAHPSEETIVAQGDGLAYRRTTGVWDDSAAIAASPVATISSWPMPLTVPGHESVPAWAISAVTVSPTHRRRGIATAMLEAELRAAQQLGHPIAMLTVSEATIYGRYGFAPAALTAGWRIDSRHATWDGPDASGRVQFLTTEMLREQGPAIVERGRLKVPGEIERWGYWWDRMLGLTGEEKEREKGLRVVRYDDVDGVAQGFAIFSLTPSTSGVFSHGMQVHDLFAATDDAYAGLWRFLIEMDLVDDVIAPLRSVDEAFAWQVSDFRAAHKTDERDHLWVRILDVAAALEARRYNADGTFVLELDDRLGLATPRVLVEIADGSARVSAFDGEVPAGASALSMSVNQLGSLYLGGISATSLARAGRVTELVPGSADAFDASFHSAIAPRTSIWF